MIQRIVSLEIPISSFAPLNNKIITNEIIENGAI